MITKLWKLGAYMAQLKTGARFCSRCSCAGLSSERRNLTLPRKSDLLIEATDNSPAFMDRPQRTGIE